MTHPVVKVYNICNYVVMSAASCQRVEKRSKCDKRKMKVVGYNQRKKYLMYLFIIWTSRFPHLSYIKNERAIIFNKDKEITR